MVAFRTLIWLFGMIGTVGIVLLFGCMGFGRSLSDFGDVVVVLELIASLLTWLMLLTCVDKVCQVNDRSDERDD